MLPSEIQEGWKNRSKQIPVYRTPVRLNADRQSCNPAASHFYGRISPNHVGMTSVTVALCTKNSIPAVSEAKADSEDSRERAGENPLLPSYSPCLEAYSELSWQTKISLFLYSTCFVFFLFVCFFLLVCFSPLFPCELRKQNEYMHIQIRIKAIKTRLSWLPEKKKKTEGKVVQN